MESEFDLYNEERNVNEKDGIYLEEEVEDDLLGESAAGVLRTLGGGIVDSELLRTDLQQAIGASICKV